MSIVVLVYSGYRTKSPAPNSHITNVTKRVGKLYLKSAYFIFTIPLLARTLLSEMKCWWIIIIIRILALYSINTCGLLQCERCKSNVSRWSMIHLLRLGSTDIKRLEPYGVLTYASQVPQAVSWGVLSGTKCGHINSPSSRVVRLVPTSIKNAKESYLVFLNYRK